MRLPSEAIHHGWRSSGTKLTRARLFACLQMRAASCIAGDRYTCECRATRTGVRGDDASPAVVEAEGAAATADRAYNKTGAPGAQPTRRPTAANPEGAIRRLRHGPYEVSKEEPELQQSNTDILAPTTVPTAVATPKQGSSRSTYACEISTLPLYKDAVASIQHHNQVSNAADDGRQGAVGTP